MKKISALLLGLSLIALTSPALAAPATGEPIKIGDISMYSKAPEYANPYKMAVDLAVSEINADGGINGRPLEVVSRDSRMDPGEAVKLAEELFARDKVQIFMNCDSSAATLALSSWAMRNKIPLIDTNSDADSIIWKHGNDYVFRTIFGGYTQMSATIKMAKEQHGDKLKGKRWVTIAPNYEYGHSIIDAAKLVATEQNLDPQWVAEQWPAYGKLDAGATVAALKHAKPDVIVSLMLNDDLVKFVREGHKRGLFKDTIVISPPLAIPEHFEQLKNETPVGWYSVGFPVGEIDAPAFVKFREAFKVRYNEPPSTTGLYGYNGVQAIAAALRKAGSTDPEMVRNALEEVRFQTPLGEQHFRKIDRQATGTFWVGVSGLKGGKGALTNWRVEKIEDHAPSDAWILEQRTNANAMK
ncbi:MAG: ABC transporter substrate-binding protein [Alphaproteobacteria bacterium]|nr:ABC transporter substrate-binding protein [Alphaproteobacteria bacterium]